MNWLLDGCFLLFCTSPLHPIQHAPSPPLHLHRMLSVYPQTKTYFAHWSDLSANSAPVKAHGKKVMGGVALAVARIDDLAKGLLELSEKHAFQIKVDPTNFKVGYGPLTPSQTHQDIMMFLFYVEYRRYFRTTVFFLTDISCAHFYAQPELDLRTNYARVLNGERGTTADFKS